MKKEIFKFIKFAKHYRVSNFGKIKNVKTGKILRGWKSSSGRLYVSLYVKNKHLNIQIAKLVLTHFKKSELGKSFALHEDLDLNNCRINNLNHGTLGDVFRMFRKIKNKNRGVYKYRVKSTNGTLWTRFRVVIKVDNQAKTIGYFAKKKDAIECYKTEFKKLYGYSPI